MKIQDVIRLKQEQHVHNEKDVLTEVSHPYLVRLWVETTQHYQTACWTQETSEHNIQFIDVELRYDLH